MHRTRINAKSTHRVAMIRWAFGLTHRLTHRVWTMRALNTRHYAGLTHRVWTGLTHQLVTHTEALSRQLFLQTLQWEIGPALTSLRADKSISSMSSFCVSSRFFACAIRRLMPAFPEALFGAAFPFAFGTPALKAERASKACDFAGAITVTLLRPPTDEAFVPASPTRLFPGDIVAEVCATHKARGASGCGAHDAWKSAWLWNT